MYIQSAAFESCVQVKDKWTCLCEHLYVKAIRNCKKRGETRIRVYDVRSYFPYDEYIYKGNNLYDFHP